MADKWSNDKVSDLIGLYEKFECLYDNKHKDYYNKNLRNKAITEISEAMGYSERVVKEKIRGLRTQYSREKNKEKRRKSGDRADNIYRSSWVHFNRLKFIDNFISDMATKSSLEDNPATTQENVEVDYDQSKTQVENTTNENGECSSLEISNSVRIKKRFLKQKKNPASKRLKEELQDAKLKKSITCMEQVASNKRASRDADDVFGEYIASELHLIKDERTKQILKFRIQSLFFSLMAPTQEQANTPISGAQQCPNPS